MNALYLNFRQGMETLGTMNFHVIYQTRVPVFRHGLKTFERDKPFGFALHAKLFRTVFCFAFLRNNIFIPDQKVKTKSNRNRNCIFSFPWESQGSHVESFLLCFTYPSKLPLQTDTYIDELAEIFLKLSIKTV